MNISHSKPFFNRVDDESVLQVLKSGFVTNGAKAKEFSKLVALKTGKQWGIATQSGTDAIVTALLLAGVKTGDRVGLPSYMCSAPLDALSIIGALPFPFDIDRRTLSIGHESISVIREIVATIIVPHLFGIPVNIEDQKNVTIIEDCAQTLNANIGSKRVGCMGKFTVCSFYGTKLLTTGHGGMILGDEESDYDRAIHLLTHDKQDKWDAHYHFLMSDFNAALGISQINQLDKFIEQRIKIAERFNFALTGNKKIANSIYSRFLIKVPNIGDAISFFKHAGVETKRPVYKPISKLLNLDDTKFSTTNWAYDHILSIPIYPALAKSEIKTIADLLYIKRDEIEPWPPIS